MGGEAGRAVSIPCPAAAREGERSGRGAGCHAAGGEGPHQLHRLPHALRGEAEWSARAGLGLPAWKPPEPLPSPTQASTGLSLAQAHPGPMELSPASPTYRHWSPRPPSQPHSQVPDPSLLARPAPRMPGPSLSGPQGALYRDMPSFCSWDGTSLLHPRGLLGGGWEAAGTGAHLLPLPGLPGTDPEEAILSAFRMFDPNGKGVVNKDE